ncbi:hypothetical protein BKA60DRAFT_603050 [Fusarium oxysporum]|nr:hypothetical protein BKA60DRAFT_603050 [Fusarium oxysporum]
MTSTIIIIIMPKILRLISIPKSLYPRIILQQNRIPFPNWQVPLHKGQIHKPGLHYYRLRQLLTPTTWRRPMAQTFYAHRAAYITQTKYIQRSLPPLQSVFNRLGMQTYNHCSSFSKPLSFLTISRQ